MLILTENGTNNERHIRKQTIIEGDESCGFNQNESVSH